MITRQVQIGLVAAVLSSCSGTDEPHVAQTTAAVATPVIGRTEGTFSVGHDGQAAYSIPIDVPPGRAGVQPELSLEYASGSGNGLLGPGWSLSGLPRIQRCPRTVAQDGQAAGIKWDSRDRFCLDGVRLVAIAGSYGVSGSEYRSERETYSKIVLKDGVFNVYRKDGRLFVLNAPWMVVDKEGNNPQTLAWDVGRIEDPVGNRVVVQYKTEPEYAGEHIPSQITYSRSVLTPGDSKTAANFGDSYTRMVAFDYDVRLDVESGFVAGRAFKLAHHLSRIRTLAPLGSGGAVAPLRSYELTYMSSPETQRWLLASVQECDANGACKKPTTFSYERGADGFDDIQAPVNLRSGAAMTTEEQWLWMLHTGDINGDGFDDILYRKPLQDTSGRWYGRWYYRLSTGGALGTETLAQDIPDTPYVPYGSGNAGQLVDINLDGKADFAIWTYDPTTQTGRNQIFYSNGVHFVAESPDHEDGGNFVGTPSADYQPILYVGDFAGNGYPDVVRPVFTRDGSAAHWALRPNNGGALGPTYFELGSQALPDGLPAQPGSPSYLVDLNGDGIVQLVHQFGSFDTEYDADQVTDPSQLTTTQHFNMPSIPGLSNTDTRRLFADVNGDGLEDALMFDASGGPAAYSPSDGRGFIYYFATKVQANDPRYWIGPSRVNGLGIDPGVRVIDYDGDGRSDLLLLDSANYNYRTNVSILRFRGDGSVDAIQTGTHVGDPVGQMGYKLAKTLDIDGNGLTDFVQLVGNDLHIYQRRGAVPDMLLHVVDGNAQTVDITYGRLTDFTVYTPASSCSGGTYCLLRGRPVVASETTSTSAPSPLTSLTLTHTYEDGRVDLAGRGFLGFARHVVHDAARGSYTTYDFQNSTSYLLVHTNPSGPDATDRIYPALGLPLSITTVVKLATGNHTIRRTFTYARQDTDGALDGGIPYYEYPQQVHDTEQETDGTSISADTTYEVDSLGNIRTVIRQSAHHLDIVSTEFDNSKTARWLIGEPTRVTTFSRGADGSEATRVETIDWDTLGRGVPVTITQQPDATDSTHSVTRLDFDGTRVLTKVVTTDLANDDRSVGYVYDLADHVFPVEVHDGLDHVTKLTYHPGLGVVTRAEDPNHVATITWYDNFGRSVFVDQPDSADVTIAYQTSLYGAYAVSRAQAHNGTRITHYDSFDRPVLEQNTGYDGRWVYQATTYDNLGRVASVTQPYFAGDTIYNNTFQYDQLDRLLKTTTFDRAVVTYQPSLLRPCAINARNRTSCKTLDEAGLVTSSIDYDDSNLQHTTTFTYGPFGLRKNIVDELGNVTSTGYDVLGRRISFKDPDSHAFSFGYNGVGDLVTMTDGLGRPTTITPDKLGRAVTISSPDGTQTNTWDPTNGIGQLGSTTSASGVYTLYTYDALGRSAWKFNSSQAGIAGSYMTYDAYGRVSTVQYPQVGNTTVTATYGYTTTGFLSSVTSSAGALSYQITERNAAGDPTTETFGSGIITTTRGYQPGAGLLTDIVSTNWGSTKLQDVHYGYDADRNLSSRRDYLDGTIESFSYDYLDRLGGWTNTSAAGTRQQSFKYDVLGNLLEMRVVSGPGVTQLLTPASATIGPHRLASSNAGSYSYDDNGNQTNGPGRTIRYTAFDLPSSITAGGKTTSFRYTGDNVRATKDDGAGTQTLYLDELFERRTTPTATTYVVMLQGERGPIGELVMDGSGNITDQSYILDDRLGSVDLSSDRFGVSRGKGRFTPFGQRTTPAQQNVRLGFTGHEHDDELGLIDMRGRIYDPAIGRFLTRDPVIADAQFSQALNPYSYVFNNPLTLTDPSGFEGEPEGEPVPWPPLDPLPPSMRTPQPSPQTGGGTARSVSSGTPPPPRVFPSSRFDDTSAVTTRAAEPEVIYEYENGWTSPGEAFLAGAKDGTLLALSVVQFVVVGGPIVRLGLAGLRYGAVYYAPRLAAGASGLAANVWRWGRSQANGRALGLTSLPTWKPLRSSQSLPEIRVSRARYPDVARHIEEAQAAGKPQELTIDRAGADARRDASLRGTPVRFALDRDEYPPAMFREGGAGASVRYIYPPDNRGAGSSIRWQVAPYRNGTRVRIVVVD